MNRNKSATIRSFGIPFLGVVVCLWLAMAWTAGADAESSNTAISADLSAKVENFASDRAPAITPGLAMEATWVAACLNDIGVEAEVVSQPGVIAVRTGQSGQVNAGEASEACSTEFVQA